MQAELFLRGVDHGQRREHQHRRYSGTDCGLRKGHIDGIHDHKHRRGQKAENAIQHDDREKVCHTDNRQSGDGEKGQQGYGNDNINHGFPRCLLCPGR